MGFLKAKSKVSLIMAVAFAALIGVSVLISAPLYVPKILLTLLAFVFVIRLVKTKKFIPSGLMLLITGITLVLVQTLN